MDCPRRIQLPLELLSELAKAIRYDDRWIGLRVSFSFDYFLVKNLAKIRQKKDKNSVRFQQGFRSLNENIEKCKTLVKRRYGEQAIDESRGLSYVILDIVKYLIAMEKAVSEKKKARMN
ncbi:hypothetical protein niasHS_014240 [Heterodera schachtii]|uniref:Uncharacterized protein n=1 Tax=Heterodera schachtii TaxID=97005 RepID=A0ABD2IAE0_HETSC